MQAHVTHFMCAVIALQHRFQLLVIFEGTLIVTWPCDR